MSNFTLILEPKNKKPLYIQIYEFIIKELKSGALAPGDKLPSKRRLAAHLLVSQNTVETAYGQLMAEGYIKSLPKKGYFICAFEGKLPNYLKEEDKNKKADILLSIKDENQFEAEKYKYDFKTNQIDTAFFPFSVWKKVNNQVLQDKNKQLLDLAHPQGEYILRKSIAGYLHQFRGVSCKPEQIIIGAGTEYLIGLIIQILGRKTVFALENPGYPKTYKILKSNDVKVMPIALDEEGIRVELIEASGAEAAYITPSHQFPRGIIMPISRGMQMLAWANLKENRYIIEDDYDSEFRFVGRPIPALQGLDNQGRVIYISTFSRSIAPSIRISYMVLPPKLLERFKRHFSFYSSTVSRFEQFSLYKFIEGGYFERHLNKMRNIYKARKDKLVGEIKKIAPGKIEIIGENAGLHLLLKVNNNLGERELLKRAKNLGVKLTGLSEYYFDALEDCPENIVVLGYAGFNSEALENAAALLKKAWFA